MEIREISESKNTILTLKAEIANEFLNFYTELAPKLASDMQKIKEYFIQLLQITSSFCHQ